MTTKRTTRLTRLEARIHGICGDVFSAWLEALPTEDLIAIVDAPAGQSPPRRTLENWLMTMHPVPTIRADLWRQAIKKVLDPHGLDDGATEHLAAQLKEMVADGEDESRNGRAPMKNSRYVPTDQGLRDGVDVV